MSRILVLDDDHHIVRTLQIMLEGDGHSVITACTAEDALDLLTRQSVDIALVDLQLPGISGTDFLKRVRDTHRDVETLIITAHGSIESAVEAMKEGAFDYLTKPFSPDQVRLRLGQLERVRELKTEVAGLRRRVGSLPFRESFVTQNPATLHMLEVARNVAATDATVLITGETGTGKTLLARLIHESSTRRERPFVVVDCTSFQESLLESELFGHRRGAFTGAVADKKGKVEMAEGGTLFLDEIGEVPTHLQGKLLRLVEERSYECVGDPETRKVDARILAATNRDLEELVRDKLFREDLFFRLSVVELNILALRNRVEDILLLAANLRVSLAQAHGKKIVDWDREVESALLRYKWPGNVRELANAMERAMLLAPGRTIRLEHLPRRLVVAEASREAGTGITPLAQLEEEQIRRALAMDLPLEETARRLGIDPSTLWRKRKKYNV